MLLLIRYMAPILVSRCCYILFSASDVIFVVLFACRVLFVVKRKKKKTGIEEERMRDQDALLFFTSEYERVEGLKTVWE